MLALIAGRGRGFGQPFDHEVEPEAGADDNPHRCQVAGVQPDAEPPTDQPIKRYPSYQIAERAPRITAALGKTI